jgi:CpeT protein
MMRLLLLALLILPISSLAQRTRQLEELAYTMAGSYTSAAQAKADTSYFAWFYVEQATASSKAKPYRQRVYHVKQVNDSTFTSTILTIKGGERFFGAYADPVKLEQIPKDSLETLEGCDITLVRRGRDYVGSTNDRDCPNKRGEATYATSEVTLRPDRMISWDRGWNDAGVQVWGAEKGGYIFIKR